MAASSSKCCDCDTTGVKSVAIPCRHEFCLTCLTRLKMNENKNCPKCGQHWADLDEQRRIDGHEVCKKHDLPYQVWCYQEQDFYCIKCIVEKNNKKIELINNSIPQIRADLNQRVIDRIEKSESSILRLEEIEAAFNEQLIAVRDFMKPLLKLDRDNQERMAIIESLKAEMVKSASVAAQVGERMEKVRSILDVSIVVESRIILECLDQPFEAPGSKDSEVLLQNIASTYTKQTSAEGPPSETTFIYELPKASGSSFGLLADAVCAAEELKGGGEWTLDSNNCQAVLLALDARHPSVLSLITRPDEPEALPAPAVAAVAKAASNCWIEIRFLDSFFKPEDINTDLGRLEELTKDNSPRGIITQFYGYLDAAGIANLPRTIQHLGLAIGSADDATAISDLRPWEGLRGLHVSISGGVAAQHLKTLPTVNNTYLHFPGLTDARVDSVRPAIEALLPGSVRLDTEPLMPDKEHCRVLFPTCLLTADGTRRLGTLLSGIDLEVVYFDLSGPWQPEEEEKDSIEKEFPSIVGWDMGWLYN